MSMSTPWGYSQTVKTVAKGVRSISTASHGGYHLDTERQETFRSLFPDFQTWAGEGWFEEDCDWALVYVTFPELFNDQGIFNALQSIRASVRVETAKWDEKTRSYGQWDKVWTVLLEKRRELFDREKAFQETHADQWQAGSAMTGGDGWRVCFTRLRDGLERVVSMPKYPSKQFYTETELSGGFENV